MYRPSIDLTILTKRLAERAGIGPYLAKACIKVMHEKMAETVVAGIQAKLDRWPMPKASRFEDTVMWLRGFGRLEVRVGAGQPVYQGLIGSEQAKSYEQVVVFPWLTFIEDADLAEKINPTIGSWWRHNRNKKTNELIRKGVYSNKRKKKGKG